MSQIMYRLLIIQTIFLYVVTSTNVQAEEITFLKATEVDPTTFIKSIPSDVCHSPDSKSRSPLNVYKDKSNVYQTLTDCIADDGKITSAMKEKLYKESPEMLAEIELTQEKVEQEKKAGAKFAGINWGLGLAFTNLGVGAVKDVTIEDGNIRVNHEVENQAVALVESHYFFVHEGRKSTWGHGPFLAIGLIAEDGIDPLSTYGVGYMIGLKNPDGTSWNMGLGVYIDSDVPRLRDGIEDGDSTTETDPTKLITSKDEEGAMLMFSANF